MRKLLLSFSALTLFYVLATGVKAKEPGPVKATGVVSEEFGIDHSNWDQSPNPVISFTQTEKIFPTTIIMKGKTVQPLKLSPQQLDIGELSIDDPVTGRSITVEALLTRFPHFFPGGNYRNQFWIRSAEKKQIFIMGIHGQTCYIDYKKDLVIVAFGAYPLAKDLIMIESIKTMWDGVAGAVDYR